jgi:hypothetical protein
LLLNTFGWRATAQGGGWLALDAAPIPHHKLLPLIFICITPVKARIRRLKAV